MKSKGFSKAWALEGGLDAWRAGYPVEEMVSGAP
jgi:hypothetical protein